MKKTICAMVLALSASSCNKPYDQKIGTYFTNEGMELPVRVTIVPDSDDLCRMYVDVNGNQKYDPGKDIVEDSWTNYQPCDEF